MSVAWVQGIQAPNPDQRRDIRQKPNHRCKVCPSGRSLCMGLPSGQFLGVDLGRVFVLKLPELPYIAAMIGSDAK